MEAVSLAWRRVAGLLGQPRLTRRILRSYYRVHRRLPCLFPPVTYNEKIQYRKLFDRRPLLTTLSDKYEVRRYVHEKLGLDLSPRLYHLTEDPSTIPFDDLPAQFVVKPTHGSGWVQLVPNKSELDRAALIARCRGWLARDFSCLNNEWSYRQVPRRIMVEEFLNGEEGVPPPDIKLLVFNQRVRIIQVDAGRCDVHLRNFFDPQWNELGIGGKEHRGTVEIARPSRLDDMIRYAEKLSEDIDFVRVDMYQVGERIYFGEMTLTPASGLDPLEPPGTDRAWGSFWTMDFRTIHGPKTSRKINKRG